MPDRDKIKQEVIDAGKNPDHAWLTWFDHAVGSVIDKLKEKGILENTLIVITSDHGNYNFGKSTIYEGGIKVPLMMYWPAGIKAGSAYNELVQNIDFTPTLLDVAGVEAPADMQGESLVPLFKGQNEGFRDAVYYHYYEYPAVHMVKRHYGIVTEDYKLAHFYYDVDEWELYDRKKDPQEMQNEYNNP